MSVNGISRRGQISSFDSEFFTKAKARGGRVRDSLEGRENRSERAEVATERAHSKNVGKRRRIQEEITDPKAPASSVKPKEVVPVEDPKPSEARTMAEKYVSQYEQQSGRVLSSEERGAKVKEVEEFYSNALREGRLDKIVFA